MTREADPEADEHHAIASAAAFMIVTILGSAAAGVVRDVVYANRFGAEAGWSAFAQAFRVPDLIYFLLAGGALRTGFIPVFAQYRERGEERQAWHTFGAVFGLVLIAGSLVVALGALLAPALARLVAGGAAFTADDVARCGHFMRVMFPAQLFFVAGGLLAGAHNALRRFFWPGLAPILYNIVLIVAALLFAARFKLVGQSVAVVVGAILASFLVQFTPLLRYGRRVLPRLDLRDPGLKQVLLLSAPIIFGLAVPEINHIIVNRFALDVTERGAGLLYYTDRLATLTVRAFGGGVAIAVFPVLSALVARGEIEEFKSRLSLGIRNVVFLSVPSIVLVLLLREPIVWFLFVTGKFTAQDAYDVSRTLVWYGAGVVPFAIMGVVARAFYAMRDTRTPVIAGLIALLGGFLAAYLLRVPFGLGGCAAAWSVTPLVNVALMLIALRLRLGHLGGRRMLLAAGKAAFASAVMGLLTYLTLTWLTRDLDLAAAGKLQQLACLVAPAVVGVASFVVLSLLLRVEEAQSAANLLRRRFRRNRGAPIP